MAGLAITYGLNFSWLTNETISIITENEKMMVGVERVLEYVNETPSEEEEGAQVEDVKVEVKFDDNHLMNMPN